MRGRKHPAFKKKGLKKPKKTARSDENEQRRANSPGDVPMEGDGSSGNVFNNNFNINFTNHYHNNFNVFITPPSFWNQGGQSPSQQISY